MSYKPKYFTISELTRSTTALRRNIRNIPGRLETDHLLALIENTLDPVRIMWGGPITVSSGYRCYELNKAVGGAKASSHMNGEAADITVGGKEKNWELYQKIKNSGIPFTKLIYERNASGVYWIHISYVKGFVTRKSYIYDIKTKTYKPD